MEKIWYPHTNIVLRGLNFIFRKIPCNKLHYCGILMKKDMTSNLPSVKPTDYSFRQANLQDIRYISEQPESLNYEVYKDRLSKGHICYCAYNQDEVMCYVWFSFNTCGLFFGTGEWKTCSDFRHYHQTKYIRIIYIPIINSGRKVLHPSSIGIVIFH